MPKDKELRVKIVWLHHNVLVVEYRERWKTIELVTRNYWWLGVTRDIGKYIDGCNLCQRMKNRIEAPAEKLKLSEILERLWIYLIVDFIMKLPLVARKDTILVVCDRLSKIIHFVTTIKGISVEGLVQLFRNNI